MDVMDVETIIIIIVPPIQAKPQFTVYPGIPEGKDTGLEPIIISEAHVTTLWGWSW